MYTIKQLHKADRPREKLEKYGVEKMSTHELIAILLRTGRAGKSAIQLAKEIEIVINQKQKELKLTHLTNIKGIGIAKACEIMSAIELSNRINSNTSGYSIENPEQIWHSLIDIRSNKKEHFIVFFLNASSKVIAREIISIGTLTQSLVHPREVFESAIKHSAAGIIISHNHPSGNLDPSAEDMLVTQNIMAAGTILHIPLIDHVIVSKDGWFSFKDKNLLKL